VPWRFSYNPDRNLHQFVGRSVPQTVPADSFATMVSAKKQIEFGAEQGVPAILLIYDNIDPVFQGFGTEPMDFTAAMYGVYTIIINRETKTASDWFNGKGQMLRESKKTSFSAVGHLCDRGGTTMVTPYENVFAKIKVPYS